MKYADLAAPFHHKDAYAYWDQRDEISQVRYIGNPNYWKRLPLPRIYDSGVNGFFV